MIVFILCCILSITFFIVGKKINEKQSKILKERIEFLNDEIINSAKIRLELNQQITVLTKEKRFVITTKDDVIQFLKDNGVIKSN